MARDLGQRQDGGTDAGMGHGAGHAQTTLVASSWAMIGAPPAAMILAPAQPSLPMPVSITAQLSGPKCWATLRNSGSTEGRQKFSGAVCDRRATQTVPSRATWK